MAEAATHPEEMQSRSRGRLTLAIYFGLFGLGLGAVSRLTLATHDMYHEMALFRAALTEGRLPTEDLFAYTPTVSPSVHHEWGTGAVLYLATVASGLGAPGLMALKYLLSLALALGCVWCARRRGASLELFATLFPLMIPLGWVGFTTLRAQLFTLLFLAVLLVCLDADRRGRRWWLAAWLPLYVVWLNMHAGFVVGAGIFALHALERTVRSWARLPTVRCVLAESWHLYAGGFAMLALLGCNPYGWEYVPYLWHGLRLPRPEIREWGPLWQTYQPALSLMAYAISVGLAIYAARVRGWRKLEGLVLVAITAWLAVRHIRHGSIYAVVWLCYVPAWLRETSLGCSIQQAWEARPAVFARIALACGLSGVVYAAGHRCWELQLPTSQPVGLVSFPAGAVDYLRTQHFAGNVMVPFQAGAYVSWELFPDVKVSFDGRYEVAYPTTALTENFSFYRGDPGWEATLSRYATDIVLVPRASPLWAVLEDHAADAGSWPQIYQDDGYALFARPAVAQRLARTDRRGDPIVATFP